MMNRDINSILQVRDQIVLSSAMWAEIRHVMPGLSLRKVREGIVYQQLFMNERRMIYTPYNMSVTTYYSATIQADRRSPLYASQRKEFDFLWQGSEMASSRQRTGR